MRSDEVNGSNPHSSQQFCCSFQHNLLLFFINLFLFYYKQLEHQVESHRKESLGLKQNIKQLTDKTKDLSRSKEEVFGIFSLLTSQWQMSYSNLCHCNGISSIHCLEIYSQQTHL